MNTANIVSSRNYIVWAAKMSRVHLVYTERDSLSTGWAKRSKPAYFDFADKNKQAYFFWPTLYISHYGVNIINSVFFINSSSRLLISVSFNSCLFHSLLLLVVGKRTTLGAQPCYRHAAPTLWLHSLGFGWGLYCLRYAGMSSYVWWKNFKNRRRSSEFSSYDKHGLIWRCRMTLFFEPPKKQKKLVRNTVFSTYCFTVYICRVSSCPYPQFSVCHHPQQNLLPLQKASVCVAELTSVELRVITGLRDKLLELRFQHLTGRVRSTRLRPYFLIWTLIM